MVLLNNRLASSAEENSNYDWIAELAEGFSDGSTFISSWPDSSRKFFVVSLVRTEGKV